MSIVRDVSVSWAELKLVTVRVARPRHRSTVEEPGLKTGAEVGHRCGISKKERAAEFAKLGGTTRIRCQKTQVDFGLQSSLGYKANLLGLGPDYCFFFLSLRPLSVVNTN